MFKFAFVKIYECFSDDDELSDDDETNKTHECIDGPAESLKGDEGSSSTASKKVDDVDKNVDLEYPSPMLTRIKVS
jgi:hypothetical protein